MSSSEDVDITASTTEPFLARMDIFVFFLLVSGISFRFFSLLINLTERGRDDGSGGRARGSSEVGKVENVNSGV